MAERPHTDDQGTTVATMRFAPGSRTSWHSHARGGIIAVIIAAFVIFPVKSVR